jgi:glycine/D-amino acid oxidase-like deaminating enzyme
MCYDFIIIGGGFFGSRLALTLQKTGGGKVLLLEKGPDLMKRASYNNQARVHNGYHYPRSLVTALRSRINFPRFNEEYSECIHSTFNKYYAVASVNSKVTAQQFRIFFERIQAPVRKAPQAVKTLFNKDLIEDVFEVQEYAFDADLLRKKIWQDLEQSAVKVQCNTNALQVKAAPNGKLQVRTLSAEGHETVHTAQWVFNCTYANINTLLQASGLQKIHLKQELTEMALVEMPELLKNTGVTVMCGPFFSVMPFPSRGLHTLSHVRYTPHHHWYDRESEHENDTHFEHHKRTSNFVPMLKDAQRYMPALQDCRYVESLWELKTVLPASETDDSRPILFKQDAQLPNLYSIMGGKIDNIYDMEDEVQELNLKAVHE